MLRITIAVLLLFSGALWLPTIRAQDSPAVVHAPKPEALVQAAERAIQRVEQSSAEYLKQRECYSCHHQAMSIMALMAARQHGLKVDMPNLQRQVQRTLDHLERGAADYRQGKGQGGGVDTSGYALTALSIAEVPRNDTTTAVVHFLLHIHENKRHWGCTGDRPPTQSNDLSTTAVAMLGLEYYFDPARTDVTPDAVQRLNKRILDCDQWLAQQQPSDTEQRFSRSLIHKARAGFERRHGIPTQTQVDQSKGSVPDQLREELLATQNTDGGWAQLPQAQSEATTVTEDPKSVYHRSDAYATATALFALVTNGLSTDHPAYQRGLRYLLDTQLPDGSWHVVTRSKPIQKYFESGFPHGVDQFISMQATCWSIIAISQALPLAPASSLPPLPWLNAPATDTVASPEPVREPLPEELEFFEREIRPLLVENCVSCHGPDDQSGDLRVDSLASLLKGGESGPAIVPQAVERSLLIKAVRRQDELKMPPEAPLSGVNVARLERWIEMGAPWPKNLDAKDLDKRRAAAQEHWAFQLPREAELPPVNTPQWSRGYVDQFVLAGLEQHSLTPNLPADRPALLRKLSYDLVGLPPTADETVQFVEDERPDAVDRVIDRLLASPKFGEHWGRHWLDVARYSDTKGYVYAREERFFVHAPIYRDWVVRALADDMPYDQFVKLQVAADQVAPQDARAQAAMGFLTVGRRFLGVTHDIIDDRIDVVSRGLLGLTVGCARCHDHKFDPIPTADYYSLYGVFQNSIERKVRIPDGRSADDLKAFEDEYVKRQQKYQEQLAAEKKIVNERTLNRLADYLKAQLELEKYPAEGFDVLIQKDDLVPAQLRRIQAYLIEAAVGRDPIFEAWRQFLALSSEEFAAGSATVCNQLQQMPPAQLNPLVARLFRQPPKSMQQVAELYGQLLGRLDLVVCDNEVERRALQELNQFVQSDHSPFRMPDEDIVSTEQFFETRVCEALWKLQGEVDRWIIQNRISPDFATVLVDRAAIREPHIFKRGNPRMIGDRVPRQFLAALCEPSSSSSAVAVQPNASESVRMVSTDPVSRIGNDVGSSRMPRRPFEHGSGRRELAEAIADPRNPLTARVWANRVWQHLFGTGLVATASDFGLRANPPSHPELLDRLALDLQGHGYSSKHIIRQIVSSSAYQQSSKPMNAAGEAMFAKANDLDPDNRWLWRGNTRRLTFEQQRDAWLQAAGQLDFSLGGRAQPLFGEGFNTRRTLYGLVDRQFLSGVLRVFDFANPDLHIPQRSETTVPQQALFEMNHDFSATVARQLAALVERQPFNAPGNGDAPGADLDRHKVISLFRQVLGRTPTAQELSDALEFVRQPADLVPKPRDEVFDWKYGYAAVNAQSGAVECFTELPHFTGTAWQGGTKWPDEKLGWAQLTATGGHAGNDLQHAVVRRWTAPSDGILQIRSQVVHNVAAGDGVRALVILQRSNSASQILKNEIVHNTQIDFHLENLSVSQGDHVDFVVNFNANLNSDQFLWAPEIRMLDRTWHAERDFVGKQPNYLKPWEQLAQVLLLSNEMVYVE